MARQSDTGVVVDGGHLAYLIECALELKDIAVTIGGVLLKHPPFRYDDGLSYRNAQVA
jgi:hypothetical protein